MSKIYSLFIGRWQPLHEGHKHIIQKVLDEGKNVCIAIRNTPISEKNPFSVEERFNIIRIAFPDFERVQIIVIPDIAEVCYGRNVGWDIRDLSNVPAEIAQVSATKVREQMRKDGKL
jgi:adenylylsulfate kinase